MREKMGKNYFCVPLKNSLLKSVFYALCFLVCVFFVSCASSSENLGGTDFYADNISDFRTEKLSNGIPVFFKQNRGSKVVVLKMIFEGGVASYEIKKDGIEDFALELAFHGSKNFSYDEIQKLEYEKSFSMNYSAGRDYSTAGFLCIFRDLNEVTSIFADTILNPDMDEKIFNQIATEKLDSISRRKAEPTGNLGLELSKLAFKNHPYEISPSVREETFSSITIEDLKKHFSALLNSGRIKLVVVADMNVDETKEYAASLEKYFGPIEKKSWIKPVLPPLEISGETVYAENAAAGESGYIAGIFSCPERDSAEYIPFAIATMYLDDIFFDQVREKAGAVYSIGTGVIGGKKMLGAISVYKGNNSKNLKSLIDSAILSFDSAKTSGKLEQYKSKYITSLFASSQNASGIAENIVSSLENYGSESAYLKRSEKVQKVTAKQVNAAYEKYIRKAAGVQGSSWVVVSGAESVKTFGF